MSCTLTAALALSMHMGLVGDYNETHPALKCDRDDTGLIAGVFLNSESRASVYGGIKFSDPAPGRDLWVEAGIVTGYTSADVLPYVRLGLDLNDRTSLFVAPAIEAKRGGGYRTGIVAGIEYRFSMKGS